MFRKISFRSGAKIRAALSLLFAGLFSFLAQAQEEKSAIADYGEHHPALFISGIFVIVLVAVLVVYFIFKKTSKEPPSTASTGGFSKPAGPRTGKHPDRRYIHKKSVPR